MIGIITIAHGDKRYIDMAINMVKSLKLLNNKWPTAVITDQVDSIGLKTHFDYLIPLNEKLGKGLIHKFHLYDYSPFKETLFIDSDCLVMHSLDGLYELCHLHSFVALGNELAYQEWYMDVEEMKERFSLNAIPKFNGGFYYFKKDQLAKRIYEKAIQLVRGYEDYGFVRFRGGVNEEPVMAVAMALHGVICVDDQGTGMRTPLDIEGAFKLDFLKREVVFKKRGFWVKPAIIHFCGSIAGGFHYKREVLKIRLAWKQWPEWAIKVVAMCMNIRYTIWVMIKRVVKLIIRREPIKFKPLLPIYSNH